jgi:hypothetical protein
MSTLTVYWIAALVIAFFMTAGMAKASKRLQRTALVTIKLDQDADPRRRRR